MHRSNSECYPNPDGTRGWVWNPITGSLGDCPNPNARRLAHGQLKERYLANVDSISPYERDGKYVRLYSSDDKLNDPFYPRFWPERLIQPFEVKGSAGIFPCNMSDLFGIGIPYEWTEAVMNVIKIANQHCFYLLTKEPQNLQKFSPFPDNCYPGVTVCNNGMMTLALQGLSQVKAKIRYISFEPLLGMVGMNDHMSMNGIVDWVIIGAQTKPYKPPRIEWVREIVEATDKAGIPVFLKNNLRDLLVPAALMDDIFWESEKAKLRQEIPG